MYFSVGIVKIKPIQCRYFNDFLLNVTLRSRFFKFLTKIKANWSDYYLRVKACVGNCRSTETAIKVDFCNDPRNREGTTL